VIKRLHLLFQQQLLQKASMIALQKDTHDESITFIDISNLLLEDLVIASNGHSFFGVFNRRTHLVL
jgi:hypothetical protein